MALLKRYGKNNFFFFKKKRNNPQPSLFIYIYYNKKDAVHRLNDNGFIWKIISN